MTNREEFETHLRARGLSKRTIKEYLFCLTQFERECRNIDPNTINRFLAKRNGFVPRAFLRQLFEFMEARGITNLPKIPKAPKKINKINKKLPSPQEIKGVRSYILKHNNYKFVLMFDITYYCGLRREEICKVTMDDFSWKDYKKGAKLKLKVYAKGRERTVVIPPKLSARIIKYFIENISKIKSGRVFRVGHKRWDQVFRQGKDNFLGIKHKFSLHDLRRYRATKWLDKGVDLDEVRWRLGHVDISTTQKYLIRDEEDRLKKWENEK